LHVLCDIAQVKAVTLLLLFLPATPMLFMGQEIATDSPFLYFADHAGELGKAITQGRRQEFAHFAAFCDTDPKGVPDPQAEESFLQSKVRWDVDGAAAVREFHRLALRLRREDAVLRGPRDSSAGVEGAVLWVLAVGTAGRRLLLLNVGGPVTLYEIGSQDAAGAQVLLSTAPVQTDDARVNLPAECCVILALPQAGREPNPS
jgi:maltooligosyltrehalose trehalohydrolase